MSGGCEMREPLNILYLAHDLDDAAIWRRKDMFERGGATVDVVGFERKQVDRAHSALSLGTTRDGDFKQRIWRVVSNLPFLPRTIKRSGLQRPDVIVARNMEALALGLRLKAHWGGDIPLVYELLDIHRLQHGQSAKSKAVRAVEAWMLKSTDLVMISSEAFKTNYLDAFEMPDVPTLLIENKVLLRDGQMLERPRPQRQVASPERIAIGWFGILRCSWTLSQLDALTRALPGQFEIVMRGRPALDQMPDFHETVEANPDLQFGGAYRWPDDLPSIYAECDFVWMIDRFDSGGNSDWLLPNRLYEGALFGAIPIGLNGTAIAARLQAIGIGLVLDDISLDTLAQAMSQVQRVQINSMRTDVLSQNLGKWVTDQSECRALVKTLSNLKHEPNTSGQPVMDG
ncbi:hypothetical protein TA5114_03453 [Cognatishimia activa]|uniref:Glycosyltransferase subfamily 4-like N-terminal domain-containing protein n=2 Tax=Cognatishimia activa TaxID=1715691 RepID=A0A0P1JE58_9RHOB|nr:hypothetical protein TA5113_02591 [Cognatishimia activa]CUK27625.1 hypothetical protein TA5114_03453 [Cognatishimia activa]